MARKKKQVKVARKTSAWRPGMVGRPPVTEEAVKLREVFTGKVLALRDSGAKIEDIARKMKVGIATVRRMLAKARQSA